MKVPGPRPRTTFFQQVEETVKRDYLPFAGGRSRGLPARLLKALSELASRLYGRAVLLRNQLYSSGALARRRLPLPAVSVGNITVGGTGKTPFVQYVAGLLRRLGRRPAVIARGYGPAVAWCRGPVNDEGLLLARNLPDVPVLLSPDRLSAAFRALDLGADCAVLDDAFQHLRAERDLDVVLLDATVPLGFGRVLPRGLLREPMRGLARADVIVINRADLARRGDLTVLENVISRAAPGKPVFLARQRPVRLVRLEDGRSETLRLLEDQPVGTFCGLGNPYPFGLLLRWLGAEVVYARRFPDHHLYGRGEVAEVARAARQSGARLLVTTQKDAVKIPPELAATLEVPLYYLLIRAELVEGEERFLGLLSEALTAAEER